ncbi:transcriptional regulator ATRX-like [Sabethes cyaneus]|uniref:transcriptional regulator ATRX-like n=1 Tax=Sabethes cyaneus TaxID=53552 RepID=UPI00237EBAB4|nr:transcriptional regulator ATRX-like [Sabethes cyaneus]
MEMAAAVEEPDLFNGLEITEMDELNMENGDEYVFIPSDNENDEENGNGGDHDSLASHSVFERAAVSAVSHSQVATVQQTEGGVVAITDRTSTEADEEKALPRIDLATLLQKTFGDDIDSETEETANVDMSVAAQAPKDQENERFMVRYDLSLDTQALLSLDQTEIMASLGADAASCQTGHDVGITIKGEIDIEEAVINFPDDEEAGLSNLPGMHLEIIDHDDHHLGSEVITLDSDAAESETDEDCVLMSLIEQCPITVEDEGPNEDKTPVENDHAYTSQTSLTEAIPHGAVKIKKELNIQTLVEISKQLLEEASSPVDDINETLRSIATLEEHVNSLKEKILSRREIDALTPGEPDNVPVELPSNDAQPCPAGLELAPVASPLPADQDISDHIPQLPIDAPRTTVLQQELTETDNLSVVLSENCSERLECHSLSDLAMSEVNEAVPSTNPATSDGVLKEMSIDSDGDISSYEDVMTNDLSKLLSPHRSEPLEAGNGCDVDMQHDPVNETGDVAECGDPTAETEVEDAVPGTDRSEMECDSDANKNENKIEQSNEVNKAKHLCITSIDDLIAYGEVFANECDKWGSKIKEYRKNLKPACETDDASLEREDSPSDVNESNRLEEFVAKLTKCMQRLSSTEHPAKSTPPIIEKVSISVQTERRKLTAEKAKVLNEKCKQRLLSSLAAVEAVYSDSSVGEESYVSNDGADSGDSADVTRPELDSDDEAFERRQNRRKNKRLERDKLRNLKQRSEQEKVKSEEKDDVSDSDVFPSRSRNNINRLKDTDSRSDGEKMDQEDSSEPDLSQYLVPKSPLSSAVGTVEENISVKNEPYSENDSEPVCRKRIIRTDSVDYGNDGVDDETGNESVTKMDDEEDFDPSVKLESSLSIVDSQNVVPSQEKLNEENEEAHSSRDGEEQSDSELLDDVLPPVDDILLDVDDILPAAEGVVQDYLVEEEVRTEQDILEQKNDTSVDLTDEPKKIVTKNDTDTDQKSENRGNAKKEKQPNLEDMTESELEEYYDNLREKEIDKLCNLDNLEVARNAYPQKPQEVKKKQVVIKKKNHVIEDILNDVEMQHESDDSDSDTEVLETEELFLQKCNENMKHQMLNQLSSSDSGNNSGSDDSIVEALRQDREGDSDDSAGSILMEKFLKSLNKDHPASDEDEEEEKADVSDHDDSNEEDSDREKTAETKKSVIVKESEKNFIDDSMEKGDNEEAMEKMKERLQKSVHIKSDTQIVTTDEKSAKEKSGESKVSVSKTTNIDPIDKQLFSKKMFREVDETLQKDRERGTPGRENGSVTDRSERIASEDSDVELLDVSMFQPKRKLKEKPLEGFDFSVTAKRGAQIKRKDVKEDDCISLSSESEPEVEETKDETEEKENKQRKIRTMLTQDQLADETKTAQKDEEIRVSRLKKKNDHLKKFLTTFKPGQDESDLVLDYDSKTSCPICVHPDIVKLLKPHQREGVRFMYDNTYGSIDYINKHPGSGCILAHCMGLGKTLQLITLLHTVMRYPQLKTRRVLVICPKSTVMNWSDEIQHWLGSLKSGPRLKVFYFPDNSDVNDKLKVLSDWYSSTANRCGCMLIGYEAFRVLVNYEKRKRTPSNILAAKAAFVKKKVDEYLLNPGADLVICDEGHQIKNKKSAISGAVSQIKTRRRIVLTGTPIQNNLKEYYCMVNFIKPSFLGSDREFNNLYANPIKNGQHKDSDNRAIKIMKQRSYVLHNKLSKFVQRREAGVLKEFLPEKFEYVLFVPLTPVQEKMYEVFLQMNEYTTPAGENIVEGARGKKFKLLADYTSLRKIWTHPKVLEKAWETAVQEKTKRDARFRLTSTPDSDDDRPDDYNDISSGALSVTNDWWRRHLEANDLESLYPSGKLRVMFEILKQSHERGEKCLIFSAFVAVLNVVEHFMAKIHNQEKDPAADVYGYSAFKGPWEPGIDYYRLDGKTQKTIRHRMITSFNDPSNKRTKCFLISAKAGGQGINLIGANRVIILDTSWNPSNDQQNIFRIFRLGQKKKCYVYRLLAMGTMEEKVYSRSVTKQAMSFRVVDEQQIDRHYSFSELAELYSLSRVADQVRETPILPADDLLASLLRNFPACVFKYHEHDSLLENKPEQDLSEDEKKEAWAAYEREIQNNEKPSYLGNLGMMPGFMGAGFPGPPGSGIGPYPPMSYPGLSGTLADMYRSDFGYGSSMNRLMYPYTQQPFSMMNDPSYSSIMGKQTFPNFSLPGSSSSIPDFAYPSAMNGQGPPGATSYNSTAALQTLLDLYAKSMSSGMSSSTVTTTTATQGSPSTSASAVSVSPYNALSSLKQFNGFPPPNAPGVSPGLSLPSQQHPPPSAAGLSTSATSSNAALINMLNEQPMPMSSAASSGPFSHLNSPLPAPSIPIPPRSTPSTTVSSMATPLPVLTNSTVVKNVAPNISPAPNPTVSPQQSAKPTGPSPSPITKQATIETNQAKPVPLTTTVVASDDDDVDDDGVPRPHIIVRDPSSINATGQAKPTDKDKVVKKINMGIVYPEEKNQKDQSKNIMLGAKSITNLTKPTIAVKNVESMKAIVPPGSTPGSNIKTASPVHALPRPGSASSKPIRASPVQLMHQNLSKPQPAGANQAIIPRTPPSVSSQSMTLKQQSAPPRQQVPVITSAKSLQMSTINSHTSPSQGSFGLQQRSAHISPATSNASTILPTSMSTAALPRGAIAAQQLRELQQRMNQNNSNSNTTNLASQSSHLVVSKAKKTAAQMIANRQRSLAAMKQQPQQQVHPVGLFASPAAKLQGVNQKQQKSPISAVSASSAPRMTKTVSPLSDSVSITKITSTGQRIAMNNPSISSISNTNSNSPGISPALLSSSIGRKQDLVITKTVPGAATVRKVVSGPNMIVKPHMAPAAKRTFPPVSPVMRNTATATTTQSPTMNSTLAGNASGATSRIVSTAPSSSTIGNSITVRKRKAPEPTLIDSFKAKNNSITISEVRSIYQPPVAKKPNQGPPVQAQKRLGSGITITPRKPSNQQPQQNVEVVEIE